jgi:ribose transport system permease protein
VSRSDEATGRAAVPERATAGDVETSASRRVGSTGAPEAPAATVRGVAGTVIARGGVLLAFGVMALAFTLARPSTFPTIDNVKSILVNAAPGMIVALGLTVVLVMGDFDLSIGSMVGLGAGAAIAVMVYHDVAWQLALVIVLGLGVAVGVANGMLVAVFRGNSFIMTLGMATILTGVEFAFTSQATVFQDVPQGYVDIGAGSIAGLSNQVWIALGVAVVLWILLDATEIGRFMYAIGGNPEAARLSGIRTRVLRTFGFGIVAFSAALVGILISSAGAGYTPNAGQYLLLPAYAGAFLGAASFRPGEFNIPGTVVGVLFLGTIGTGLTLLNLQTYLINLVQGAILIAAVLLSTVAARRP